jgi:AraC-like DNA-binding protein
MRWFGRKSPSIVEDIRVLRADARVDDAPAMTRLLESLPEAGEIRSQLNRNFFARAWDKSSNRDYWIRSDGRLAACFTVCGLNLKQAAAVRVRWDALASQLALSERLLAELVSAETGETVQTISFVKCERTAPLESTASVPSA